MGSPHLVNAIQDKKKGKLLSTIFRDARNLPVDPFGLVSQKKYKFEYLLSTTTQTDEYALRYTKSESQLDFTRQLAK